MPYNPNDPNYQTKSSRVLNFDDFDKNINKEKEELKKMNRSSVKPDSEINQTPGNLKFKYNKVTHKMDNISKSEIEDNIEAIEDLGIKDKHHKYRLVDEHVINRIGKNILSPKTKKIRMEKSGEKSYSFLEIVNDDAKNAKEIILTSKQREQIEKILNKG